VSSAVLPGVDRRAFIAANTSVLAPPLVPEIRLHLAEESLPIWQRTEEELGAIGLPPPFWAFAWAGGQALARFVLDHPDEVAGKRVLDLAAGSGLVAIAAAMAGACRVTAVDIDPFAGAAVVANAALNGVEVATASDDLLDGPPLDVDCVLVGDIFYEQTLAARTLAWLRRCEAAGQAVVVGDPRRGYCPTDQLVALADYSVPVTRELEDAEIKRSTVWRLRPI
jgi:predicted nicotinamide N-methyase